MISTTVTFTVDQTVDRAAVGTSCGTAVSAVMAAAAKDKSVDYRIPADLRASSFAGGHVWLRPAADVLVPTTGHPAWSPPT